MILKKLAVYSLLASFIPGLFSCTKDKVTESYTFYRPVYQTSELARKSIKGAVAQPVEYPGKLVVKDHYLFLTELGKGVHVIDYSNPRQPKNIGFVNIPGNEDISVRGHYLYADCYTALAVIDIAQPENATLTSFVNGVFPDRYTGLASDSNKIIISWARVDTTVTRRFSESFDKALDNTVWVLNDAAFSSNAIVKAATGNTNSTAGSMARFALADDRMYVVGTSELRVFNTVDAAQPAFVKNVALFMSGIETIYPYKNNLFIGTQVGMLIYSISNKDNPVKAGQFGHVKVCDPVVADDDYAYVTLRAGSGCGSNNVNELNVLSVADLTNPALVKAYTLTNPYGLSKDGDLLLVCDGKAGLKIFDAAKADDVKQVGALAGFDAYDVITLNGTALVSGKGAFLFVDYSDPAHPSVLSQLTIAK